MYAMKNRRDGRRLWGMHMGIGVFLWAVAEDEEGGDEVVEIDFA